MVYNKAHIKTVTDMMLFPFLIVYLSLLIL